MRRRPLVLIVLAMVGAIRCAGEVGSPPDANVEVTEEQLRRCPRDDRLWQLALQQAGQEHRFEPLLALGQELARAHPTRWEPPWLIGECRLGIDPNSSPAELGTLFERALALAEASGDRAGIARAANRAAGAKKDLREFEPAESLYRLALDAATSIQRDELIGIIQNNLAGLLRSTGRPAEAVQAWEAASRSLRASGRLDLLRRANYNRAALLSELGQLGEAQDLLQQVYDEASAAKAEDELAKIAVVFGNLHLLVGDLATARTWYMRVPPDHPTQAPWASLGLGRLAVREKHYQEAAGHLERARTLPAVSSPKMLAQALRADVDLRSGDPEGARARLSPLLDAAEQSLNVAWIAPWVYGKSLLTGRGGGEAAIPYFERSIAAIEARGAGLNPAQEGMAYLRERAEPFADLAWAVAARRREAAAVLGLDIAERAHARALRQILRSEGDTPLPPVALAALQRRLGERELLLDFLIGDERGVLIAIDRTTARIVQLPGWSTLRAPLDRYRAALRRPLVSAEARLDPLRDLSRDLDVGVHLRSELLGPVEDLLARARRVYVVPDQDLALLPFAALPAKGDLRFLGDELEVAVLPIAGAPAAWGTDWGPFLIAGDPLPDPAGEFARLELAGAELDAVEHVWKGADVTRLEGRDFVARALRALPLASYRTLHLATHAIASSRDPARCAVVLSGGERIGMREVAALDLGPALVILSACQTGEGEVIPGEGVVGLSWAFLSAGARGVVASLWSVEDASTTELMTALHRSLAGGADPVRALSEAQRSIRPQRPHPAYWAPFVVILGPEVAARPSADTGRAATVHD